MTRFQRDFYAAEETPQVDTRHNEGLSGRDREVAFDHTAEVRRDHPSDFNNEAYRSRRGEAQARFENSQLQTASQLFSRREGDEALWMSFAHPNVIPAGYQEHVQSRKAYAPNPSRVPPADKAYRRKHSRAVCSLRRSASIAVLLLAFPVAVAAAAFSFSDAVENSTRNLVSALLDGSNVAEDVFEVLNCASRARVVDTTRQAVSWIPVTGGCRQPGGPASQDLTRSPHLITSTVQDDRTVELLAPAIAALEGDHNGPGTFYALNARGLGRVFVREIQRLWSPDLARFGGSTAVLSGFETLRDLHGRQLTEAQKIRNMRDMVAYVATSLPQGIERDRFAATTNPVLLVHGGPAGGMSVSGEMALESLFGRPFIEAEWEACLFAAAFKTQIVIPAPSARPEIARARYDIFISSLAAAKRRAVDVCLARLEDRGELSGDAAESARQALAEFQPNASGWTHGTEAHLPGAFAALMDERRLLGPEAGSAETYLDPTAQHTLSRAVEVVRNRTAGSIDEGLCHTVCDDGQHAVDVLAVAVELDEGSEQVVAIHQSRGGLFHGPVVLGEDAYVRGEATRSLGSLPKLYLGLRLAAEGITHLCPRDALSLSDADGAPAADCSDRAQWLTLEESMARSSNRAFAEGILILGIPTILEGMRALGSEIADERNRRRIVTGVGVPVSPERFIRFLTALGRGLDGRPASSYLPQISSGPHQGYLELPGELFTAHPALLRDVLAAPVMHPQGTLRDLREPLNQRGCDMASIIAKTGSSETADDAGTGIRDRYIALQVSCPDANGVMRDIALFSMIGSPQIDIPLTGVTAEDVRRLALATLDAGLASAAAETRTPANAGE